MPKKPATSSNAPNVLLVTKKNGWKSAPATAAPPPPETARPGDVVFTAIGGGALQFHMAGGWWWRWTGTAWSNALELTPLSDPEIQNLAATRQKKLKNLGYL